MKPGNGLIVKPSDKKKGKEAGGCADDNVFDNVFLFIMSKFVREDCFNFIFGEVIEERIAVKNSFGFAYAGKGGVCFFGILAHVKLENVLDFYAGILCQGVYPAYEIFILQGSYFVKHRKNDNRDYAGEKNRQYKHEHRHWEPPD